MSEKPEALRLAENLVNQWSGLPDNVGAAAKELRRQHAEIERLKAEIERLRGLLAEAQKAVWMNYDNDLLDRIEAALKEVPR